MKSFGTHGGIEIFCAKMETFHTHLTILDVYAFVITFWIEGSKSTGSFSDVYRL